MSIERQANWDDRGATSDGRSFETLRNRMVAQQILARGILDPHVIEAMRRVRRELFVPQKLRGDAYEDRPLPIGSGQTISQPYIVAFMIDALGLDGGETVLEIGAGSGYAAAVLAEIASRVYAIERIGLLAEQARENLSRADYSNVVVRHADGIAGWPERAPFDAILVSAGAREIPDELLRQLKVGGVMVVPVGDAYSVQELLRIERTGEDAFAQKEIADVRFVPLLSEVG